MSEIANAAELILPPIESIAADSPHRRQVYLSESDEAEDYKPSSRSNSALKKSSRHAMRNSTQREFGAVSRGNSRRSTAAGPSSAGISSRAEFVGMSLSSLYPYYSELVDHLYHRPVIISILIPMSMVQRKKKNKDNPTAPANVDTSIDTEKDSIVGEDESTVVDVGAAEDPNRYINPTSPVRGPIHDEIVNPTPDQRNEMKFLDDANSLSVAPSSLDGSLERAARVSDSNAVQRNTTAASTLRPGHVAELRTRAAVLRAKLKLFTIKVVDLIDSREALYPVVVRDFNSLRRDLCKEHHTNDVNDYFQPRSLLWWMRFLKYILRVFDKTSSSMEDYFASPSRSASAGSPNGKNQLAVVVDKRLIRNMVQKKLNHHRWMQQQQANHGHVMPSEHQQEVSDNAEEVDTNEDEPVAVQKTDAAAVPVDSSLNESDVIESDAELRQNQPDQQISHNATDVSDAEGVATSSSIEGFSAQEGKNKKRGMKRKKNKKKSAIGQNLCQDSGEKETEKVEVKMRRLPESYSPPLSSPIRSGPGSREAYPALRYAQNHPSPAAHRLEVMRSTSGSNAPSRSASRMNSQSASRHGSMKDPGINLAELSAAVENVNTQLEESVVSEDKGEDEKAVPIQATSRKKNKSKVKKTATAAVLMQSDAVSLSVESLDFSQSSAGVDARRSRGGTKHAAHIKKEDDLEAKKPKNKVHKTKRVDKPKSNAKEIRTAISSGSIADPTATLNEIDQHHSPWEERYTYVAARSPRPGDVGALDPSSHQGSPALHTKHLVDAAMEAAVSEEEKDSNEKIRRTAERRRRKERFEKEIQKYAAGDGGQQRVANIISWARTAVGGNEKFRTRSLNKTEVNLMKSPLAQKLYVEKKVTAKDVLRRLHKSHDGSMNVDAKLDQQVSEEVQAKDEHATNTSIPLRSQSP